MSGWGLLTVLCASVLEVVRSVHPPAVIVEKKTVPFESLKSRIEAEVFETDFLVGDSNYHSLTAASDGRVHFTLDTHDSDYASRYYVFDPKTETMSLVARIDEALGEQAATHIPQGKVHTPLFEHNGKIWFATHTSYYAGDLPRRDTEGKKPYSGGHFMSYDLATGQFEDLATGIPGEGIITLIMDKERETLYGLTWPSGILLSYDIPTDEVCCWGAVQGRGEWGHRPWEWDRICRTLALGPDGVIYGSTMDGQVWRFDRREHRPLTYIEGLDLSRLPFSQSAEETNKGEFQYNWRAIEWNELTQSFWGIQWETTTLFEFIPERKYIRAVAELRPQAYRDMPRNPEISQLGFMIGPRNTLFYLAHGPAVDIAGRPAVQSALHLITYDIEAGVMRDHGPIFLKDGRRVFFSESIAIGADERIYSVAWVEVLDPNRIAQIREARRAGPAETAAMTYEIALIRLPKWRRFVR